LIHSFRVPVPSQNFKAKFVYNFYVADESTQEDPKVPDYYKKRTIDKTSVNLDNFTLRLPRYVELTWDVPACANPMKGNLAQKIEDNKGKIATEDNVITSRYTPYFFSSYETFQNAANDVKRDVEGMSLSELGMSQSTIIDNFVNDMLKDYDESAEKVDVDLVKDRIRTAIASIEAIGDRPDGFLGYQFYNEKNEKISVNGFNALMQSNLKLYSQINDRLLVDIFAEANLPNDVISNLNAAYNASPKENTEETLALEHVSVEANSNYQIPDASQNTTIVGYLIQRYKLDNNSYKKDKLIFIENPTANNIFDVNVRYGTTYLYSIRTIARVEIPLPGDNEINNYAFYVSGKAVTTSVTCDEDVAPPPPEELGFIWNYKENKFYLTWSMPFNSQNDVKQFQIFRRKTINEPFELLEQHCFDQSSIKRPTGEIIDGNKLDMSNEEKSFVKYSPTSTYSYCDDDFKINTETLQSSKYIYALASIDAHGYISNYSAQVEVTFDFFKNKLVKKLISNAGAPRPYPNLYLNVDLFKDTIATSGMSSQKLKIYFMPEYFKVIYNSGKIQKMVSTNQDGGYYKLQFINTQNQKTDSLTIKINDEQNLVSIK